MSDVELWVFDSPGTQYGDEREPTVEEVGQWLSEVSMTKSQWVALHDAVDRIMWIGDPLVGHEESEQG